MAYSDQQKYVACELVKRNKGAIDDGLMAIIRETLDAPKLSRTNVWRWWRHYEQMQPETATDATAKNAGMNDTELDELFERAARKFVNHALRDELLIWTSSKDAIIAAGVAVDKMRLLRDLPTEIIGAAPVLTELAEFLKEHNLDMSAAVRQFLDAMKAKAETDA